MLCARCTITPAATAAHQRANYTICSIFEYTLRIKSEEACRQPDKTNILKQTKIVVEIKNERNYCLCETHLYILIAFTRCVKHFPRNDRVGTTKNSRLKLFSVRSLASRGRLNLTKILRKDTRMQTIARKTVCRRGFHLNSSNIGGERERGLRSSRFQNFQLAVSRFVRFAEAKSFQYRRNLVDVFLALPTLDELFATLHLTSSQSSFCKGEHATVMKRR